MICAAPNITVVVDGLTARIVQIGRRSTQHWVPNMDANRTSKTTSIKKMTERCNQLIEENKYLRRELRRTREQIDTIFKTIRVNLDERK